MSSRSASGTVSERRRRRSGTAALASLVARRIQDPGTHELASVVCRDLAYRGGMLGAMDLLEAAGRNFEKAVAAVPDTAWDNDTPCGIVLSEVVDHVVTGNLFSALVLTGAPPAQVRGVLTGDHLGEDPVGAVATSCARQHAAFTAADPALSVPHPIGDISLETFVRFRIGDLVVHAWDVARGAKLNETLPPALVEPLWDMVWPHLEEMRAMGTFGDGATLGLDTRTPLQVRLLDAFGRRT